jgi:DtxR family Mn-dependent transcriptional regulator
MEMKDASDRLDSLSLPQQRYIETIAELVRQAGQARMTDVASKLGVSLPSASETVKRLVELGFALRVEHQGINLTPAGTHVAAQLDRRHYALRGFITNVMAMRVETADEIACRVEHCVDKEFTERLLELEEYLEQYHPHALRDIAQHFDNRRK